VDKIYVVVQPEDGETDADVIPDADGDIDLGSDDMIDLSGGGASAASTARRAARKAADTANKTARALSSAVESAGLKKLGRRQKSSKRATSKSKSSIQEL
jgi:hypothetical protein